MPDDVNQNIKKIVMEILELPSAEAPSEEQFTQLLQAVESVAMLEILVTLERTYQIQLYEEEIRALREWRQLIELIKAKISNKQPAMPERSRG